MQRRNNRLPGTAGWAAEVLSPTGCVGTSLLIKLAPQIHRRILLRPVEHSAQSRPLSRLEKDPNHIGPSSGNSADEYFDPTGLLMRARPDTRAQYPFLLPPLREQHCIVEAIESYLTRLDDAVADLERVHRNLRRFRASVLKAAAEGRVVPSTDAQMARKEGKEAISVDVELGIKQK